MKTAYFILGMHRSGTSALGGVLDIMGLEFGSELMPPHEENPKGYFENNLVVALNEKILDENSSSWDDDYFNVQDISKENIKIYIEQAKEIILSEFEYAQKFVIKDPRICLLFPIWELACKDLNIVIKIILPYRNPMEVARSLKKRDAFPIEKGLMLWTKHFLSAEYFSREYERMFLSFDELLFETKKSVDKLYQFTSFKGQKKRKAIGEFLDKDIKHNNIAIENFTKEIPRFLKELLKILQDNNFGDYETLNIIRDDFNYSQKLFNYNYKEQIQEIEFLKKKVILLEKITDIAMVDKIYYSQSNEDLANFDNPIEEHYFLYGRDEGRKPNEYCSIFNIDTRNLIGHDEKNYLLEKELHDTEKVNIEQEAQIEEQTKHLEELNKTVEIVQSEKVQIEQEYQTKLQEVENLNKEFNDVVEDLVALKESKEQLKEQLHDTEKVNIEQEAQIEEQTKHLEELNKTVEIVQSEKVQIEQEALDLNQSIDAIINDLASIKESKCWVYTKPLRDIQKVLAGDRNE